MGVKYDGQGNFLLNEDILCRSYRITRKTKINSVAKYCPSGNRSEASKTFYPYTLTN